MNSHIATRLSGEGPALVWGHGLMSSMTHEDACAVFDWGRLSTCMQLLRYDAKGHGDSEVSENSDDFLWQRLAQDLLEAAADKGIERFTAGGRSMGCGTALFAGLQAPERVKKLVLVNPPTAGKMRASRMEVYNRMAQLIKKRGVDSLVQMVKAFPSTPSWLLEEKPELTELQAASLQKFAGNDLIAILQGTIKSDFPDMDVLTSLDIPTLILAWTDDPIHPLESARRLDDLLPESKLIIASTWTEVKAWTQHVIDFVHG